MMKPLKFERVGRPSGRKAVALMIRAARSSRGARAAARRVANVAVTRSAATSHIF